MLNNLAGQENMAENKTEYTPTEALECLENISRNSLYKDMKDGSISYETRPWGKRKQRFIQGSELARFYGSAFKPENENGSTQENETGQPVTTPQDKKTTQENNTLQVEVKVLRERINDKDQIIEDLKNDKEDLKKERDSWQKQAETLLIAAPQKPTQAANENSSAGVGGNKEKAIRGKNFAIFGAAIAAVIFVLFLGVVFGPEIQNHLNGVGGFNSIAPASGTTEKP